MIKYNRKQMTTEVLSISYRIYWFHQYLPIVKYDWIYNTYIYHHRRLASKTMWIGDLSKTNVTSRVGVDFSSSREGWFSISNVEFHLICRQTWKEKENIPYLNNRDPELWIKPWDPFSWYTHLSILIFTPPPPHTHTHTYLLSMPTEDTWHFSDKRGLTSCERSMIVDFTEVILRDVVMVLP